jgi:hypothetical protein
LGCSHVEVHLLWTTNVIETSEGFIVH